MTTLLTCCNNWLGAAALVLFASAATGHAVHSPDDSAPATRVEHLQQQHSVDELLRLYSLRGDDTLLAAAAQQLPPADELRSPGDLLQAAWLAQADHQFVRALELLERILQRQPHNGQAWLMQAAVSTVTGDDAAARRACGQVLLSVSPDAAVVCFASLADTSARKAAAYARLRSLPAPHNATRLTAWRVSVQAELARDLGKVSEAEALLLQAITIFPAVQTRATLMDLYLQQGRYAAARDLSAEHEAVPALAVRRLLAMRGLGEDIRGDAARMDARFHEWLKNADYRHAREMAMFYLDIKPRANLAFQAATENAILQREPEDLALLARASNLHRQGKNI